MISRSGLIHWSDFRKKKKSPLNNHLKLWWTLLANWGSVYSTFYVLSVGIFLVGGREGNEHFKSSNSRLNNLSVSQSLSLCSCLYHWYLLFSPTQQPKKGKSRLQWLSRDPSWLLFWLLVMFPDHWTYIDLCYLACSLELFKNVYLDLPLSMCPFLHPGSNWPTLMVENSWFEHLVCTFCLIIIPLAHTPSDLALVL